MLPSDVPRPDEQVDYRTFGEEFFAAALAGDRVEGLLDVLEGHPIDVPAVGVGPGRLVRISASGQFGRGRAIRIDEDPVRLRLEMPVDLGFRVDLPMDSQRYDVGLRVSVELELRALTGLRLHLYVVPPGPADVVVQVHPHGLRASLVGRLADIEGELRRFVARFMATTLDKPEIRSVRTVELGPLLDLAWAKLRPEREDAEIRAVEDLEGELAQELREHGESYVAQPRPEEADPPV